MEILSELAVIIRFVASFGFLVAAILNYRDTFKFYTFGGISMAL